MSNADGDWLKAGRGRPPSIRWSVTTDAPLVTLQLARETNEVLAADTSGGLYLIDRLGRIGRLFRGAGPVHDLAWADTGQIGIALVDENRLQWFNRQLSLLGEVELPERGHAVACEAHGRFMACALIDGFNFLYSSARKLVKKFESQQPLASLEFLRRRTGLIGVTELGSLSAFEFDGVQKWSQRLYGNVGDLAVSGDDRTILLASFSLGVQCHDGAGTQVGSYQMEGAASRVAISYDGSRIAASTLERVIFWLKKDGTVSWATHLPEEPVRLLVSPLGDSIILGLRNGRILCMEWT